MGFFGDWLSKLTKTNVGDNYGTGKGPARLDRIIKGDERRRSTTPRAPQTNNDDRLDRILENDDRLRRDDDPEPESIAEMGPMHTGEVVYSPQSSCVAWYQYHLGAENHEPLLYIGYKGDKGGVSAYAYQNVSIDEALSLHAAGSKGTWVWDNLRIRGTVFGYLKPYFFLDGISTAPRQWHDAGQESRTRHGHIPPSGEPWEGYHPATNYAGAKGGMGRKRGNHKPWNNDKGLGKK